MARRRVVKSQEDIEIFPSRKRRVRVDKVQEERVVKGKFIEDKVAKVQPLSALNPKQADYINLINSKSLVVATGYAGTSKTYIPTVMACDALIKGKVNGGIDKIVLTRPNMSNSPSLGMFKGSIIEKMSPWLAPVLTTMKERLGYESLILHLEKGNIEFLPLEVVKGYSASDCFFICDEAEDLNWDDAKKLVTRQGRNCTMILAGDITQSELKEGSGLKKVVELVNKYPQLEAGAIDFNDFSEIVRSKATREWVKILSKECL